jgi:hypothetical protein
MEEDARRERGGEQATYFAKISRPWREGESRNREIGLGGMGGWKQGRTPLESPLVGAHRHHRSWLFRPSSRPTRPLMPRLPQSLLGVVASVIVVFNAQQLVVRRHPSLDPGPCHVTLFACHAMDDSSIAVTLPRPTLSPGGSCIAAVALLAVTPDDRAAGFIAGRT